MNAGELILLSGPKGVGKTTVASALGELLEKQGKEVWIHTDCVVLENVKADLRRGCTVIVETVDGEFPIKPTRTISMDFGNRR